MALSSTLRKNFHLLKSFHKSVFGIKKRLDIEKRVTKSKYRRLVTNVEKGYLLFSNWHGGVMVEAVMHQAQGGEDRFPAGPRALLSCFQSGRKGLGSCNRFEKLNK